MARAFLISERIDKNGSSGRLVVASLLAVLVGIVGGPRGALGQTPRSCLGLFLNRQRTIVDLLFGSGAPKTANGTSDFSALPLPGRLLNPSEYSHLTFEIDFDQFIQDGKGPQSEPSNQVRGSVKMFYGKSERSLLIVSGFYSLDDGRDSRPHRTSVFIPVNIEVKEVRQVEDGSLYVLDWSALNGRAANPLWGQFGAFSAHNGGDRPAGRFLVLLNDPGVTGDSILTVQSPNDPIDQSRRAHIVIDGLSYRVTEQYLVTARR